MHKTEKNTIVILYESPNMPYIVSYTMVVYSYIYIHILQYIILCFTIYTALRDAIHKHSLFSYYNRVNCDIVDIDRTAWT